MATEDFTGFIGACDGGWSCAYLNTISWATPTTPLPMEINPRVVFERLFGGTGTAAQRQARQALGRSILDSVVPEATRAAGGPGTRAIRTASTSISTTCAKSSAASSGPRRAPTADVSAVSAPFGVPTDFTEHVGLMFDLLAVAYQTDLTRVFSFMMARELSQRTYPELGAPDPHHAISHHRNDPELLMAARQGADLSLLSCSPSSSKKLQDTPDGDGSLLDHSILIYGSGMSQLEPALAQGSAARGRRWRCRAGQGRPSPGVSDAAPIANLLLGFGQKMGCQMEAFGDSSGVVDL